MNVRSILKAVGLVHWSVILLTGSHTLLAQDIENSAATGNKTRTAPLSGQPASRLSAPLGTYLIVEGRSYSGSGKVESNSVEIETVNGRRLPKPILMRVAHCTLPRGVRIKLRGYELGQMIGRPPAEYSAARDLGHDPGELARRDAVGWQWRTYFVPLIADHPRGLEIRTDWPFAQETLPKIPQDRR